MDGPHCRLCRCRPAIENSHVIPAFVFRAIKSDSPSGFLRNAYSPNVRMQDGDKQPLLCSECERAFGEAENQFATRIFADFHSKDESRFTYGPWLHYFLTSLAWRTLTLDLPGFEADLTFSRPIVENLTSVAEQMRQYLRGAHCLAPLLRNHVVIFTSADTCSAKLACLGPNVMFRRSVFGYTCVEKTRGFAGVIHNLAGFLCFSIAKGAPQDTWENTRVRPEGGVIGESQNVRSWLIHDMIELMIESKQYFESSISLRQRQKLEAVALKNSMASSRRFLELDDRLIATQSQGPRTTPFR